MDHLIDKFKPIIYLHKNELTAPCSLEHYFKYSELITYKKAELINHLFSHPERHIVDKNVISNIPVNLENSNYGYLNYLGTMDNPYTIELNNVPVYAMSFEYDNYVDIVYTIIFPFNDPYKIKKLYLGGAHYGDIEHIRVRCVNEEITDIYYSAHSWDQGSWVKRKDIELINDRPIVYVAKGSHATYNKPKMYLRGFGFINDYCNKGHLWDPIIVNCNQEYNQKYFIFKGYLGLTGVSSMGSRNWKKQPKKGYKATLLYRLLLPLSKKVLKPKVY